MALRETISNACTYSYVTQFKYLNYSLSKNNTESVRRGYKSRSNLDCKNKVSVNVSKVGCRADWDIYNLSDSIQFIVVSPNYLLAIAFARV